MVCGTSTLIRTVFQSFCERIFIVQKDSGLNAAYGKYCLLNVEMYHRQNELCFISGNMTFLSIAPYIVFTTRVFRRPDQWVYIRSHADEIYILAPGIMVGEETC